MLNTLREGSRHVVIKSILIFLALTFVIWGIGDIFRGSNTNDVARIADKHSITRAALDQAFRQEVAYTQRHSETPITTETIERMGLRDQALRRLINYNLYKMYMDDQGFQLGRKTLANIIKDDQTYHNAEGLFDKEKFQRAMRYQSISEQKFLTLYSYDKLQPLFMNALTSVPIVPNALMKKLHEYGNERRIIDFIYIDKDPSWEAPTPSAADLASYYEKHKNSYQDPEYRSGHYLLIKPEHFFHTITVSEEQAREEYDIRQESFNHPETRDIHNLIFVDKKEALDALKKLKRSKNLEQTITSLTGENSFDTFLRGTVKENLPEALQETVFSLKEKGISEPIQTDFGWHVVHVQAITPASTTTFEDAKEDIVTALKKQKAEDILYQFAEQVEDEVAAGQTLEEIATSLSIKRIEIPAINQNGQLKNTALPKPDLPKDKTFLSLLFETVQDEVSPVTLMSEETAYFLLAPENIIPARIKTQEEVIPDLTTRWQYEKKQEHLKSYAESIHAELSKTEDKSAKPLAAAAKEHNIPLFENINVGRFPTHTTKDHPNLPFVLLTDLFKLSPSDHTKLHQGVSGTYFIANLRSVLKPPTLSKDHPLYTPVKEQMTEQAQQDFFYQFRDYLGIKYPVEYFIAPSDSQLNTTGEAG